MRRSALFAAAAACVAGALLTGCSSGKPAVCTDIANPTTATLTTLASSAGAVVTAGKNLSSAVSGTCD